MKEKTGKLFLIYSAAAVITASVVRFFQYVSIMDYSTGFFIKGAEPMGNLIYIILAVLVAGMLGLTILGACRKWTAVTVSSAGMGSKATIFLGASYLIAAVLKVYQLFSEEGGSFFRTVAMGAAVICFAVIGLMLMKSTVPPAVTGFLNIFPALIMFSQAVELFMSDLIIKSRSDKLLLLFVYVSGTLFFAGMARFYARLEAKLSRPREIFTAGIAFIFSGLHVVSKLLALVFGGSAAADMALSGMNEISSDALALMVISGAYLCVICITKQSSPIEYLIEKKKEKEENQ